MPMTDDPRAAAAPDGEEHRLIAERRERLAALRLQGEAFPNDFRREDLAAELQQELGERDKGELEQLDRRAAVAGRLMARRGPFLVIQDMSGRIQFYVDRKRLPAEQVEAIQAWDIGDIVGGRGAVHKPGRGDLYLCLDEARLLTKSLRPLPDKRSEERRGGKE